VRIRTQANGCDLAPRQMGAISHPGDGCELAPENRWNGCTFAPGQMHLGRDQLSLYIHPESFFANEAHPVAKAMAGDLAYFVWWPTKDAFVFDEEALAAHFAKRQPASRYTAKLLRRHRKAVATFFTVLPDGRWVPSPEYFGVTYE
jgi:hypothetical protein